MSLISLDNEKSYLKTRSALLLAIVLFVALFGPTVSAQKTIPPLPVPFTPIVDNAAVIDDATQQRLGAIYLNLKERGEIEFAVLTVDTTGDQDIFDYSLAVARQWNIGPGTSNGNGFLLVVAIQDRKYFTQVGDHLEGDLPDGLAGQIEREKLVPAFKRGQYSKGIFDTIEAYAATLAEKRGFNVEGIDQRKAYHVEEKQKPSFSSTVCCMIIFLIGIILFISAVKRGGRGGRGGGGGSGLLQALLWGSLFNNLGGSGRNWGGGSGWSGGGFGGSGGGGGGFGGGFGGGGSFGGGGAGGSW